jgi:hypothetical protein
MSCVIVDGLPRPWQGLFLVAPVAVVLADVVAGDDFMVGVCEDGGLPAES